MKRFPEEFSRILSARGRRVLAGKDPLCGAMRRGNFLAASDLLDRTKARAVTRLLGKTFGRAMIEMQVGVPAPQRAKRTAGETLHKVVRVLTTPRGKTTLAYRNAARSGFIKMLYSTSYRDFACALAGETLQGPVAVQVLCYRPGDYAGPHTDYHPEVAEARDGYVDMHMTFCTPGVRHQYIVYEREGHLTEEQSIAHTGGITLYRLPFWHYTTPLQVHPRRTSARRWLVLGSFFRPGRSQRRGS